jgi:hypothetical protein
LNKSLNKILFVAAATLIWAACSSDKGANPSGKLMASVYGEELYASEISAALGSISSERDSNAAVKEFVNAWVKRQVLLHEAQEKLSDKEKDKSLQLDQYLNDLLVYELEQKIIGQKLDTAVSDLEINRYYNDNRSNFELKENIVRLIFFKLPSDLPKIDKLWSQFQKGRKEDLEELTLTAVETGGNFFRDEDVWLSFNDLVKEIPINTYNQENFLNNTKVIRLNDNKFVYFVKILDFKIRNSASPLEFERDKIKNIILNKRKVSTVQRYEEELIRKGEENNKIKKF